MVQPSKFKHLEFNWDEHNIEEILAHSVQTNEVEECFYNRHTVYRNKRKLGRIYETFKLEGKTDGGRTLIVIFFIKSKTTVRSKMGATALIRVITAWEI